MVSQKADEQGINMRSSDIKAHLRPYSIVQKRKTTINHAFASALAPCDEYDQPRVAQAMMALGQADLNNLCCVYCGSEAETWDHLIGLVKNSQLNGYGHQIGNLVPCCRDCNSRKGSTEWQKFLQTVIRDEVRRRGIEEMLATYLATYATPVDLQRVQREHPAAWQKYNEIKEKIIELMKEADDLARQLRLIAVRDHTEVT